MNDIRSDAKAIFFKALDLKSGEDMQRYLDDACGDNSALRCRVGELLRAHQDAGNFLGGAWPQTAPVNEPITEAPGTVIGPYKLLQQLGEGGMGTVFMAEQTHPVQRKVAIKVIKPGMDSRQVIARFEAERQALAMMDHVNIARVVDAGATESGRPYFVMELVHGVPITNYCDDNHLTPRERLELFVPVCQAIQHAHQKGIIHRDIKPSNVMITLYDGKPFPKVIDFGVAKATSPSAPGLTERTLFTQYGTMVGTPEYMSPEQAEISALGVDTRSDIYSLGVLLYELLTGNTPLTHKRMKEAAYGEILRMIKEEEPPKPSTRLSDSGEALASISANRHMEPAKLTKLVRGELDWIVMKSLEKDRNRRYETANGFAADVERYLRDEPVQACPPSAGYRLRKFVRRNTRAVVTVAVVALAVLVAVGSLGWGVRDQAARAEHAARDRAARQAAMEQEVHLALNEAHRLQEQGNHYESLLAAKRAEGLLASGVVADDLRRRVEQRRADLEMVGRLEDIRLETTAVKDGHFDTAGSDSAYRRAFREYGIDVESLSAEEAAVLIRARSVPEALAVALDHWAVASRLARGADADFWTHLLAVARAADPDLGRDRFREALGQLDRTRLANLAASDASRELPSQILELLGLSLREMGAVQAAVDLLREAQRRYRGDFWINHELGHSLMALNPPQVDEALRFYTAALAIRPRSPGAHLNLGHAHLKRRAHDEAAAAFRAAIDLKPDYARAHYNLGIALAATGKHEQAIAAYRDAIRLNPNDADSYNNLGNTLERKGALDEAIEAVRAAIRLQPTDPGLAHLSLGVILGKKGELDEAIGEYRTAIRLKPELAEAHCNLGLLLQSQTKFAEALAMLRRGHELGSRDPRWQYPSAQWVQNCEYLADLDTKLPRVLDGREKAEGIKRLEYAEFCLRMKRSNVGAARLFAEGFADRPDLLEDLGREGRYNAACAAALAGTGQRNNAEGIDEIERARWRKQAIDWLQADLALWAKRLDTVKSGDRPEVRKRLLHWQSDPDLVGLRDSAALEKLPEPEREACNQLWTELTRLLEKTQPIAGPPLDVSK